MPLDDIFYKEEKPIDEARQLEDRWRKTCYATGVLAWIGLIILFLFEVGMTLEIVMISIYLMFQLPLIAIIIAFLLSKFFGFIPYKDFSKEERTNIYYYIIINLIYVILILTCFTNILEDYLHKL